MTISSVLNRASYSGNGVTTAFSFPYKFLQNADLVVIERVTATGVETVKTITTDYTVTGAGNANGGTVTMLVAPITGKTLTIYRDPSPVQGLDLVENDPLPADDLEEALDLVTMLTQRLKDLSDRTVRLSDGFSSTFNTSLPATLTAGKTMIVNPAGNGFIEGFDADDVTNASANAVIATNAAAEAAASVSLFQPAFVATQNITASGTITTTAKYIQNLKVQGNAGAQTSSTTPFGTATALDGIQIRLVGQSDTNLLTIPYSDTNHGCLLNGDAELAKGYVLTLLFDLTALRWYEVSRNF